jgi:hypothetical protein
MFGLKDPLLIASCVLTAVVVGYYVVKEIVKRYRGRTRQRSDGSRDHPLTEVMMTTEDELRRLRNRVATLERQLREIRAKIDRYVRAIGDGIDLAEVRAKLLEAKSTAATLEVQIAGLTGTVSAPDHAMLERRVADWRGVLRRGPAMARQILRKLLTGEVELLPSPEGVVFRGAVTTAGLLLGTVYGSSAVPPG